MTKKSLVETHAPQFSRGLARVRDALHLQLVVRLLPQLERHAANPAHREKIVRVLQRTETLHAQSGVDVAADYLHTELSAYAPRVFSYSNWREFFDAHVPYHGALQTKRGDIRPLLYKEVEGGRVPIEELEEIGNLARAAIEQKGGRATSRMIYAVDAAREHLQRGDTSKAILELKSAAFLSTTDAVKALERNLRDGGLNVRFDGEIASASAHTFNGTLNGSPVTISIHPHFRPPRAAGNVVYSGETPFLKSVLTIAQPAGELQDSMVAAVSKRLQPLIDAQQFFDFGTNGRSYHKDPDDAIAKAALVRDGAELHGNVVANKGSAIAIIGSPRAGKGRISFLLSQLHGFKYLSEDRVHLILSKGAVHCMGPSPQVAFRIASDYNHFALKYYRQRGFPVPQHILNPPRDPKFTFKGAPVRSSVSVPLAEGRIVPLRAVFIVQPHNSTGSKISPITEEELAATISSHEQNEMVFPTLFESSSTYSHTEVAKLSPKDKRELVLQLLRKISSKGIKFYSVSVPADTVSTSQALNREEAASLVARTLAELQKGKGS